MTENISSNKSTNSVYEYSNSFDVSVNSNLDNVLQHSKLNGDISGQSELGNSCIGVNDKKSFHITSVTVQHNSTDGNADESADESRTEELSDNIDMSAVDVQIDGADLCTENIIGKDDVLYKVTSVGSAPIIPTSAQYGIAVVSNCNNDLPDNINKFVSNDCKLNDTVKRTEFIANGLELNGSNIVPKEINTQIKNERFKVVKIESNEPFKRGRWVCMDFSDQSMDQLKKSAISINDNDKSAKKDTPEKETSPAEILLNGAVNMENIAGNKEANHEAELKATQSAQVNDSAYHNGDMSGMNSVSPNQTFNASFVPSNVNQQQAQSLTHIIIPQNAQPQVASGSYGHSQSLPHSELQHVHQTGAQQQQQQQQQQQAPSQQPIHVVTSLQQSFHAHPTMQHTQAMMTQGMQHMGGQQQQQTPAQQSDNVYSQSSQQGSMGVQQQPMMQQQSYPTLQQNTMTQSTNQRVTNAQQPQQMSNPHCLSQLPQQQSGQQNGDGMMSQGNQSAQQYQPSQGQQMQQTLQHSMQQVPLQQQSFQHTVPAQSAQPLIHQQPVQPMPTQHHSPQQAGQQQSMGTQNPTSQQASSQASLPPSNIQQPVMQQNVSHSLPQQQQQPVAAPGNVQYLPQQQQPPVIAQGNQPPTQQVVQQAPMMQQMQGNADAQLHMSVQQQLQQQNSQTLHQQSQPLPQSGQQQQILQQQMPSQMPPQQQQQQMQQMQHIPQQTQPQINQTSAAPQPAPAQQIPMQQQQIPQQIAQHHQQIIQSVPQQQQQPSQQQAPQQMMQGQQMAPQTQPMPAFANTPQPSQPPSQQVAAQVMVSSQQIPQMQQQSHQMSSHSFAPQVPMGTQQTMNGAQQPLQPSYQSPVPHQNVSGQLAENIPVSGAQSASYQHDVSVLSTDVMMSNVQPQAPNQYAMSQPQNISVQSQLPLHVSLHQQSYQNANQQPHYANAPINMMSNTSMSSQQTPPISQPQYYSQSGASITQDLQQLCGHQHVTPLISTVSSQSLPYSVQYQNGAPHSSTNVQTQTTPITQCANNVPMQQQYTIQQSIPSVLSSVMPVPVSSSYLSNVGVHATQLQPQYIQSIANPANQYGAQSNVVGDAGGAAIDQYHLQNVHLPEQVSEHAKVGEEVHFHRHDDADSTAGGSNAVAIDNKIEQAMDLVKSHLMFAVREEVEVLKEKIAELMDRINQLEIENSILKANASQETLAQLPTHTTAPSTIVSNTTNSTPASIGPANGQPP